MNALEGSSGLREQDAPFWSIIDSLELDVSPEVREQIVQRWTHIAQMEHASVASFSRFSLDLMAFGAPPELLEASHQAAIDEIHHARIAFALVSRISGSSLGPGPLPLEGVSVSSTMSEMVEATIVEGCVGESLAALEAIRAQELASVPAFVEASKIIARDEATHAELAWKTVGWALSLEPSLVSSASQVFEQCFESPLDPRVGLEELDLSDFGLLNSAQRAQLRSEVISSQLRPAAQRLTQL